MQATVAPTSSAPFSSSPVGEPQLATQRASGSRALRVCALVARVLLGLVFFVFGLDGFFHFFPMPDPSEIPAGAAALGGAFAASGYMMPLVKGTEVLVGALLLANRFVPLALILLAPVMVNIVLFHAFLATDGLVLPLVLTALQLFLAWTRRAAFSGLLRAREAS